MHRFGLVLVGCLLSSVSWAQSSSDSTKAVVNVNRRVVQHQAEVQRLQKNVTQQETASQQAAERLQQQDRTIAELRQQLKATQDASKPSATGH
ncbi:hypothetical protein [Dyella sp. 2HG41-7]|uniref:hypothetical protein n=1 Tax=Dyella sp. 2HG41-7 TaxID=2883239 RepID=UPI001F415855|nr:hypothetical protein [Dyella sp. 2HG41-7]